MSTEQEYDDDAAFLAGFSAASGDRSSEPSPSQSKSDDVVDVVDRQQTQAQPADKPQEAETDPFAALHPEVRKRIDELTAYSQESRRQLGRIADLQSRIDKLTAAVPREPAPPPRLEKVEKLQQEIPEMADALDELVSQINALKEPPAPPPQPEPDTREQIAEAMSTLDEANPSWRSALVSPEFSAWMTTQTQERQHELQTTRRPSVILKALKDFNTFNSSKPPALPANTQPAPTISRMASAVQPRSSGPRSLQPVEDDDAEFLAGFRSVRGAR